MIRAIVLSLLLLALHGLSFAAEPPPAFLHAEVNADDPVSGRSAIPRYWSVSEFVRTLPPGSWHEEKGAWRYAADKGRLSCALAPTHHTDGTRFISIAGMTENGAPLAAEVIFIRLSERFAESDKGKVAEAFFVIGSLTNALELYRIDTGRYPTTAEGLRALLVLPSVAAVPANYRGPYLQGTDIPKDPWGRTYMYRSPGEHGGFDLFSYGSDGKEGGEGKGQDIRSWDLKFRNWQP